MRPDLASAPCPARHGPDVWADLGVRPLINAAGYMTRVGNSVQEPEVIRAMAAAASSYVALDDCQRAAGERIAAVTGAEAGYVVSGAAAGLTMAAAAVLCGSDANRMQRLPDVAEFPHEIIVQTAHRGPYTRCLAASGARVVAVGLPDVTFAHDLEGAVTEKTAGIFVDAAVSAGMPLERVIDIARRHELPVIVDAALALPPSSNLRSPIAVGADIVVFAGGKVICGPPGTGFVAGRSDLVRSIALQHQDTDQLAVIATECDSRHSVSESDDARRPYLGIGRGFKVGKESIAALMTALDLYAKRDHVAAAETWNQRTHRILRALEGRVAYPMALLEARNEEQPHRIRIRVGAERCYRLYRTLLDGEPALAVGAWHDSLYVVASTLGEGDEDRVVDALIRTLGR
jgi:D-glucosaminate-6-phosphate ammonia-lyase